MQAEMKVRRLQQEHLRKGMVQAGGIAREDPTGGAMAPDKIILENNRLRMGLGLCSKHKREANGFRF